MERTVDNLCVDRPIMLTWSPSVRLADKTSQSQNHSDGGVKISKKNID